MGRLKSLDEWYSLRDELEAQTKTVPANPYGYAPQYIRPVYDMEMIKFIDNLQKEAQKLSKMQVDARRLNQWSRYDEEFEKFNDNIELVEQIFLMRVMSR